MGTGSKRFPKLLEPGVIHGLRVKNRAVSAPMGTEYALRDGTVSERLLRHYEEKAKGGAGLVIVEYAHIDQKTSMAIECQLGMYDNACIAGLSQLSEVMQQHGARTCLQIVHCGATKYTTAFPAVAPSVAPFRQAKVKAMVMPKELTMKQIEEIVEAFGEAARRTKQAGFDMVEIHGAHGYLITEFLSPLTNKRTDKYGGNLKKRMRFLLDVVERVKKKVGSDYPVGIRLSGSDYQEGGVTIEDTIALAKELERLEIAYLHISGGDAIALAAQVTPSYLPPAFNVWAAEAVKKEVRVPVIASGSLTSPELAEKTLSEGKADYVSFGRPFLADPYFMKKLENGRREDIRPCIRCLDGCLTKGTVQKRGLMCSVNVALGREERYGKLQYEEIDPAPQPRKVFVIGGGPGGMEAARVAALRGHEVTLFEKRDRLGGSLIEASIPKFKKDIVPLITYLSTQLEKLRIKIHMGKEVTFQEIEESSPDAVIVATGGKPEIPSLQGIEKPHVTSAIDILRGGKVGEKAIIIGGGWLGCEIAWYLAEQGKDVTITTRQVEIAYDMEMVHRSVMIETLSKLGIKVHVKVSLKEITDNGVVMKRLTGNGREFSLEGDNVVVMAGFAPENKLYETLREKGWKVFPVGDCVEPRKIHEAIYEGHIAGRKVG